MGLEDVGDTLSVSDGGGEEFRQSLQEVQVVLQSVREDGLVLVDGMGESIPSLLCFD